ncbi:Isopentenyl-diphosphate Delta-isomerase II, chloroplastic [Schistosoma japonicum]|nr:Isopentenyl-diphosphate Delta-isomerase II, chloroplastic [Schistosoma japonicum]
MLMSFPLSFMFSGARRYFSSQSKYMLNEFCILVDESDCVLGFANKKKCHEVLSGKSLLHRAFSLFLFREDTSNESSGSSLKLLVQKRSPNKLTFPSMWSNTCCSHPIMNFPDELIESDAIGVKKAAQRKLLHELGISNIFLPLDRIHFLCRVLYAAPNEPHLKSKFAEHELDYILVSVLDPVVTQNIADTDLMKLNPDEVSDVRWLTLNEFKDMKFFSTDHMNLSRTTDYYLCRSLITPWMRGILSSGLLQKLWNWAEASCGNHLKKSFLTKDQSWDRTRIIHLSSDDVHYFSNLDYRIEIKILMIIETVTPKIVVTSGVDGCHTSSVATSSVPVSSSPGNTNSVLLSNLWTQLDHIQPTIPDRLSVAILEGAGVQMENSDPRLARLVSLAGQKFLTDILTDAMLHWRLANGQSTGLLNHPNIPIGQTSNPTNVATAQVSNPTQSIPQSPSSGKHGANKFPTDRRATLTLEDLIASLNDRGIHVAKPPYYR